MVGEIWFVIVVVNIRNVKKSKFIKFAIFIILKNGILIIILLFYQLMLINVNINFFKIE
jgi:hypothetical protein